MTAAEMSEEATPEEKAAWKPPFVADPIENLECPECEGGDVCVERKDSYEDGTVCAAYCSTCHASLEVAVSVEVEFSDAYAPNVSPALSGAGRRRIKAIAEKVSRATTWRVRALFGMALVCIFGCAAVSDVELPSGTKAGAHIVLALLAILFIAAATALAHEKGRS